MRATQTLETRNDPDHAIHTDQVRPAVAGPVDSRQESRDALAGGGCIGRGCLVALDPPEIRIGSWRGGIMAFPSVSNEIFYCEIFSLNARSDPIRANSSSVKSLPNGNSLSCSLFLCGANSFHVFSEGYPESGRGFDNLPEGFGANGLLQQAALKA